MSDACANGHDLNDETLRLTKEGWRVCRVCDREKAQRHRSGAKGMSPCACGCGTLVAQDFKRGHHWSARSVAERLLLKVAKTPGECWEWTAATNDHGYGVVFFEGRAHGAHRVVYEALIGPVPDGLHLDHLCRVRHCVNPAHLEPVTARENTLRMWAHKRTALQLEEI